MAEGFISAEFLGPDGPERAKQCRRLAIEADRLATNARTPEIRAGYLELKRQWNLLADEIEREAQLGRSGVLPNSGAMKPG
jgi:hypothetical protein